MNDKRWIELMERALLRLGNEMPAAPALPKAYLILPRGQSCEEAPCIESVHALRDAYHLVAVLPDAEYDDGGPRGAGFAERIKRSEAVFPTEAFLTVFPVVSQSLVVKTAFCITDDFETEWIAKCIAFGQPIYMRSEGPSFTGKEPETYRKKIEACYRDVRAFGIRLDALPIRCDALQGAAVSGAPRKRRIITARDLDKLPAAETLSLHSGDVVTALAAERAEARGIRILYR
jgi:hypothetical protein